MNINELFSQNTCLFIPFIMAGHPTQKATIQALIALAQAGADIIELGVPFSDPVADGPINQHAAEIALKNNTTVSACFDLIKSFREQGFNTPLVIFSYFNPILNMGLVEFAQQAKRVGVDAVLIVDLPIEEAEQCNNIFRKENLNMVLLASPTTTHERLSQYAAFEPAFIYYISRMGVTGIQTDLSKTLQAEVHSLKEIVKNIPICVGFGITTAEQAHEIAQFADGVVVGSALVNCLDKTYATSKLIEFTKMAEGFVQAVRLSIT